MAMAPLFDPPFATFPRLIGHRGAAALAPENTLASIRAAAEAGVQWIEFDAKLAGDGVPVLMHDETLDRTTTGSGPVAALGSRDLAALDAGAWFGAGTRAVSALSAMPLRCRCGSTDIDHDASRGSAVCKVCGQVLEENKPTDTQKVASTGGDKPTEDAAAKVLAASIKTGSATASETAISATSAAEITQHPTEQ